jgi:hypothetical protein
MNDPRFDIPGGPIDPSRYLTAGIEFILVFGVFLGAGLLLDFWLESLPLLTLAGGVAGFAGALCRLVRTVRQGPGRTGDDG